MTTPEDPYPWLPLDVVIEWIGSQAAANSPAIDRARLGAAAYVEANRRDLFPRGAVTTEAPSDVVMAGCLAAARLYARKGSPAGLAAYAEFATAVLSRDADVERMLGIGRYAKPAVG